MRTFFSRSINVDAIKEDKYPESYFPPEHLPKKVKTYKGYITGTWQQEVEVRATSKLHAVRKILKGDSRIYPRWYGNPAVRYGKVTHRPNHGPGKWRHSIKPTS